MEKQIKSKKRVVDHGEVFTSEREVNAMLDLVKQETLRVDSRFLEPACGDGNFLIEILRRKLSIAIKQAIPPKNKKPIPKEYERQSIIAISSLYGVDLLQDNVSDCRKRLYDYWETESKKICNDIQIQTCKKTIMFILEKNIVCGNALTLKQVDNEGKDTEEPIVFSEWTFVTENMLQKKDYRFDKLLAGEYEAKTKQKRKYELTQKNKGQLDLLKDLETLTQKDDECLNAVISDYRKIYEY